MDWKQRVRESRSQAPGVEHVSSSDSRGSTRKSSKFDSRPPHRHNLDSKQQQHSKCKPRLSDAKKWTDEFHSNPSRPSEQQPRSYDNASTRTLEATAAPSVDEIEAALEQGRQQGRQQGREEERHARKSEEETKNAVVATTKGTTTSPENEQPNRNRKGAGMRKYICGALAVAGLIGVGIAAWLLLSPGGGSTNGDPSTITNVSGYSPPTDEECLAISRGTPIQGQDGIAAETFGVDTTFVVGSDMDLDLLRKDLEAKIQQDVLPLLAGCAVNASIVVIENENNHFIVRNSVLNTISVGHPETCSLNSEELCASVYFEVDIFPRDQDAENEELMDLLKNLFQHQDLLEHLNLEGPVEGIAVDLVFEVTQSSPTPSPSMPAKMPVDDDSSIVEQNHCEAIKRGDTVNGQDDLASQEYNIVMDVTILLETSTMNGLSSIAKALDEELQSVLMPSLAGCTTQDQSNSLITNGLVDVTAGTDETCLPDSKSPCYRFVAQVDVYMESMLSSADFGPIIEEEFRRSPLVERLGLPSPFESITVVGIFGPTAHRTTNPSIPPTGMPSANPTMAPVTYPTTNEPTRSPTEAPSLGPTTLAPTELPTQAPTKRPTPIPTAQPIVGPTLEPTPSPTPPPTPKPSTSPSTNPTHQPTLQPSSVPSQSLSSQPSARRSSQPSLAPSSVPSLMPSSQPSSPRTCFQSNDELKTAADNWFDSSGLRASVEATYGQIGDWCFGSGVTSFQDLFRDRTTFNEDISNWDVSSVTTMRTMFWGAAAFNQPIGQWDISSVTSIFGMFYGNSAFNQPLGNWDVSSVTEMKYVFGWATVFNQDIESWDMSSVTDTSFMFYQANAFNKPIGNWTMSSVTTMERMFYRADAFNQEIGDWQVSSVTVMEHMFSVTSAFNQDIADWDVSGVLNMVNMFYYASAFNQDISRWEPSSLVSMDSMFWHATNFNQNLCAWGSKLPAGAGTSGAFSYSGCPTTSTPYLSGSPPGPFCHVCV